MMGPLLVLGWMVAASPPYVIAVGVNTPEASSLFPLVYADDDAAEAASLFGATPGTTWLLTLPDRPTSELHPELLQRARPPTRGELRAVVREASAAMTRDRDGGGAPVAVVWLVGHGMELPGQDGAFAMADGLLSAAELRQEVLAPLSASAHRVHLIIDACHAAAMVRARVVDRQVDPRKAGREFARLEQVAFANVGVLYASTADQKAYEWDKVRGGIFSTLVRSALRGLADANLDGHITYDEVAGFVSSALVAIPDPWARPHVASKPPAVDPGAFLSTRAWFAHVETLPVNTGDWGPFHVRNLHGRLAAAGNLERGFQPQLWLPAGMQWVVTWTQGEHAVGFEQGHAVIQSVSGTAAERGSVQDALHAGLLQTAFGPNYLRGFRAAMDAGVATPDMVPSPSESVRHRLRPLLLLGVAPAVVLGLASGPVALVAGVVAVERSWSGFHASYERAMWLGFATSTAGGLVMTSALLVGVAWLGLALILAVAGVV